MSFYFFVVIGCIDRCEYFISVMFFSFVLVLIVVIVIGVFSGLLVLMLM